MGMGSLRGWGKVSQPDSAARAVL